MRLFPLLLVVLTAAAPGVAAQRPEYTAPRNEFGQPDLRGVWNFNSDVPLERPAAFADKTFFTRDELEKLNATREQMIDAMAKKAPVEIADRAWMDYRAQVENLRTSLIVYPENGRLPKLAEGVQRIGGFAAAFGDIAGTRPVRFMFGGIGKDGPEDRGLAERCLAGGQTTPPFTPGFDDNYFQVFQTSDHVVFAGDGGARIVPLDGKPHLGDTMRSWRGDSRGRWDGARLVVDTRNFNDLTQSFADAGTSYAKVVTERFTRVSENALEYEATIVDPKTFQDKIVLSFPMARVNVAIFEAACHEGNHSMALILGGARKEEQDAMKPGR